MDNIKTTTTTKHKWLKVSEDSWKDLKTGLTWSQDMPGEFTFDEAQQTPTKLYQILYLDDVLDPTLKWSIPTKEDFETAKKHGIREVLNMKRNIYWSSSTFLGNACYFNCVSGKIYSSIRGYYSSVRCIGRSLDG